MALLPSTVAITKSSCATENSQPVKGKREAYSRCRQNGQGRWHMLWEATTHAWGGTEAARGTPVPSVIQCTPSLGTLLLLPTSMPSSSRVAYHQLRAPPLSAHRSPSTHP